MLADPHTLVLDEATSLMDPRAARHLERQLAAVVQGRTVVAIAHRLHTAHDADRVAVVEDGNFTEIGTHDELVAWNGAYAALWRSRRDEPELAQNAPGPRKPVPFRSPARGVIGAQPGGGTTPPMRLHAPATTAPCHHCPMPLRGCGTYDLASLLSSKTMMLPP